MNEKDPQTPPGDSFAALFEQQPARPRRRARDVRIGERLELTVVQVSRDAVFVDLDEKRQAFIDAEELKGPDGKVTVEVGDLVAAHVVEIDPRSGSVRLGRSMGKLGGVAALELARENGITVEGKITGMNKGGAEVEVDGVRAFCPVSQLDVKFVQDPASFVGRSLGFRVTQVRDGGKSVVLSRRAVLEAEAREAADRILRTLAPGAVVKGTVSGVREFGAFVDLGGVEGLIPASELSHDTQVRPADVLEVGAVVEVQVKDLRPVDGGTRITLSLKALTDDPWQALDLVAPPGRVLAGTVTRLVDFGAFVRIHPGVEGLLHVSELGARVEHPSAVLAPGQPILVVVKSSDAAARKISLVPAPEKAVAGGVATTPQLVVGAIVRGTVERIEAYGIFVQVEGTRGRAGRGLVPNAELGAGRGADVRKLFPEGMQVTAKVLETGEGRLRLSLRALRDDEERAAFDGYRERANAPAKMGTLGDLLRARQKR